MTTASPPVSGSQTTSDPYTGSLSVTTDPAGAEVYGQYPAGREPGHHPGPFRRYPYAATQTGRNQVMTVPVGIDDGKTTDYSTALVPESGSSTVSLPFLAGALLILVLAGTGAYLYTKWKKVS